MIFDELDVNKIKSNKIVFEAYLKYFEGNDNVSMAFNTYYDVGDGFTGNHNDKRVYDLACNLKDEVCSRGNDVFHVNSDNEFIFGSKGFVDLTDREKRYNYLRKLCTLVQDYKYPVFFQMGRDYFLLNISSFDKLMDDIVIIDFYLFVSRRLYGKEYKNFKEQEQMHNELFKLESNLRRSILLGK